MSILKISNMNISIGGETKIEDAAFEINNGDVILFAGPNGSGKSTIIKLIMGDVFDYPSLHFGATKITYCQNDVEYDLLSSERNMEHFRQSVCYISQDDEFETTSMMDCFLTSLSHYDIEEKEQYAFNFVKRHSVAESFYLSGEPKNLDRKGKAILKKVGLDTDTKTDDIKAAKFLSLNTRHLSGGQKKLANILANLVRYEFCDLIILDEPLNNLDYENVRSFSNILNQVYKEKPHLGILLVTHCRSIPIVNRMLEIDTQSKTISETAEYRCNSCFGAVDTNGMYR